MTVATTTQDAEEHFVASRAPLQRVQHFLHAHPAFSPATVLVLACIAFSILNPRFARPENLSLVLQQVAVVGTLAIGQTLIILTAGIDLSVGAIMIAAQMVMAQTSATQGLPGWPALAIGLAVAAVAGAVNGALVTRFRLPPFIVTLGTLSVFTALGLLYSGGQTIDGTSMPDLLTWTGTIVPIGSFKITVGVVMMLALYAGFAYVLKATAWGRHVYSVGDDAEASRLAGIRVNRVLFSVYFIAGIVVGIAAWILIGRIGSASPNNGVNANLQSITAVVIGGTSLFGGRGIVIGSLLGALIVGVFNNGLTLAGVDPQYQLLTTGILVIVAVAVDQWIRKVRR